MAKKSNEQKQREQEQNQLHAKVANYMGPAPSDQAAKKIQVKSDSGKSELLPSNKLPDLNTAKATPKDDWGDSLKDNEEAPDPQLDQAIDDISAKDGDAVINAEDEKRLEEAFSSKKRGFKDKLKQFFTTWWNTPRYRWGSIIAMGVIILLAALIPPARYFVLNSVGVRASASLIVLDESSRQPLKNVQVTLGSASGTTDNDGHVQLSKIKLGRNKLTVKKIAFAPVERFHTLGWGSNPLGNLNLTPTGAQYSFKITDFLSQKPVVKAEIISGESSAFSNEQGIAVLTIEKPQADEIKAKTEAKGYRTENLTINANSEAQQEVTMAPGKKHLFVSKRKGKYEIYKIDGDGKNEELLLGATGAENDQMLLLPHPSQEKAALVSTRDNKRNNDGFLLSQLTIINTATNDIKTVASSEQIRLIGWFGDRIVFAQRTEGASGNDPKRERIISYDTAGANSKELASANYFNDIYGVNNSVFYAVASAYQPAGATGLFQINPDGSSKTTILPKEIWAIFRKDYSTLTLSVEQDWYELKIGQRSPTQLPGPPNNTESRIYTNNSANAKSLWIDQRDGKGVLLSYDIGSQKDDVLYTLKGLTYPLTWLSDRHAVFRVNDGNETADYIINIEGGEPKKIKDVTTIASVENWYYY